MTIITAKFKQKLLTVLFYGSIGLAAALALAIVFYWSLSLNSSIYSLINNTKSEPVYLWSYALLTLGTIILFGVNVPLLIYRWRKFGFSHLSFGRSGSAGGLGSLVGVAASACPVCGSALLTAVGIAGGLAAFPLQGLELKALSLGLMALPLVLLNGTCPAPRSAAYRPQDRFYLMAGLILLAGLIAVGWRLLQADPILWG